MKTKILLIITSFFLLLSFSLSDNSYAQKIKPPKPPKPHKPPPWIDPTPINPNPPAAPEPVSLILIGMGASGAVGYFLGKKNKK
jgi:hypothetical protein